MAQAKMWAVNEGGVVMVHFSEPKWRQVEDCGYYDSPNGMEWTSREFAKMTGLKLKKDVVYQFDVKASAKEVTVKKPKPGDKVVAKKGK